MNMKTRCSTILLLGVVFVEMMETIEAVCEAGRSYSNTRYICLELNLEISINQNTTNYPNLIEDNIFSNNYCPNYHFYCSIIIENSNIGVMQSNFFPPNISLTEVVLTNVGIRKLMPGAFKGVQIQELYLQDNAIQEVAEGIFNSLSEMTMLHLERNNITIINDLAFIGAISLKFLYLNHNNILKSPHNMLKTMNRLEFLDMSNNPQIAIDNISFSVSKLATEEFVFDLMDLNLSCNLLQELHEDAFFGLANLQKLDLRSNKLSSLPHDLFQELSQLWYLDLSQNKLTSFQYGFSDTNLRVLNLSYNLLQELHEDAFFGMVNLQKLDLRSNKLSSLPHGVFREMSELMYLDISQNRLTSIQYGLFDHLEKLLELNISTNSIRELDLYTFRERKCLHRLYLDHNKIKYLDLYDILAINRCNDEGGFKREVSLDKNQWNCKELSALVGLVKSNEIEIVDGSSEKTENVHNIGCRSSPYINVVTNHTKISSNSSDLDNQTVEMVSSVNSEFEKSKLISFFDKDFQKSSFFKYFDKFNRVQDKNLQEDGFPKNTEIVGDSKFEELIRSIKNENNSAIMYFLVIGLYILIGMFAMFLYLIISRNRNKYPYPYSFAASEREQSQSELL